MSEITLWLERKFRFDFPVELYPNLRVRLWGAPARLEELTLDLAREQLVRRPDNRWSIQEHVGHLLDLEEDEDDAQLDGDRVEDLGEHLAGAGIGSDVPIAIAGMEGEKEFTRVLLGDEMVLDVDLAREEHVRVARRLVAEHPDVGAIVLECTNMPPYTADIQRETGLPVFDIVSLVVMAHGALAGALGPRPA